MATSKKGKMLFESGQTFSDFAMMDDSGDHKVFTLAGATVFSGRSGYEVQVRPNGIVTGRNILAPHADDDKLTVSAFSAFSKGVLREVAATTITVTRPATAVAKINSITMDDSGAIVEVEGTDSSSSAFSEERGEAGGPPEIPADSVEIGQVRFASNTSAPIQNTEIFQVVGTHAERFDHPTWKTKNLGSGDSADSSAEKNAHVVFDDVIGNPIHTGGTYKRIYLAYYSPIFAEISKAFDFVPAENSHSLSSTQYYNGTVGSVSSSLGQAGVTVLMNDNITDTLVGLKDEILTFKFYPDRNKAPYILTQGIMGMSRTFPVDSQNQATLTISAEDPSADFAS